MTDTVEVLILDLIEWVEREGRTYEETMDAWRTSCPRLPVWEEANDRGLVERAVVDGRVIVRATSSGMAFLEQRRPTTRGLRSLERAFRTRPIWPSTDPR